MFCAHLSHFGYAVQLLPERGFSYRAGDEEMPKTLLVFTLLKIISRYQWYIDSHPSLGDCSLGRHDHCHGQTIWWEASKRYRLNKLTLQLNVLFTLVLKPDNKLFGTAVWRRKKVNY